MIAHRIAGVVFLGTVTLAAGACGKGSGIEGSGVSKTETRAVSDVSEVQLDGVGTLEIAQAPTTSLTVVADDNVLPLLTTRVDGGKLVIGCSKSVRPKTGIVVRLTSPAIRSIALTGTGDVRVHGWHSDDLAVMVPGAGDIALDGAVQRLTVNVSGTGDVDAAKLVAKDATVDVSGAGDAKVNATGTLNASVSGAGSVRYTGGAQVTKHVSGVGAIEAI